MSRPTFLKTSSWHTSRARSTASALLSSQEISTILDYLRAGDRLSNVAFLGATLLRIKPTVEVVDGLLVATKKRRGTMLKYVAQLVEDFVNREPMDLSRVNLTYSVGCGPYPLIRRVVEKILADHGAQSIEWVKSGCVIASHAGPGAFGIAALAKNA